MESSPALTPLIVATVASCISSNPRPITSSAPENQSSPCIDAIQEAQQALVHDVCQMEDLFEVRARLHQACLEQRVSLAGYPAFLCLPNPIHFIAEYTRQRLNTAIDACRRRNPSRDPYHYRPRAYAKR